MEQFRLYTHKIKFNSKKNTGTLLNYSELSKKEKLHLTHEFLKEVYKDKNKSDPYKLYAKVCFEWGVMCPHPVMTREELNKKYFNCKSCDTVVVNFDLTNDEIDQIVHNFDQK